MTTEVIQFLNKMPVEYGSYLVRVWRPTPRADWRLMIEVISTGERRGFVTLEALFHFLAEQMKEQATSSKPRPPPTSE